MVLRCFLIVLFSALSFEAISQTFLLMDKLGGKQRREFYPGDELTFRLKGDDHFNTAIITHLHDTTIFFGEGVISLHEIDAIRLGTNGKGFLGSSGPAKISLAGVILIVIDQLNNMAISGDPFRVNRGVLIVGGSLIGIGIILKLIKKNIYRIGGNRRLKIVDVGFG